MSSATASIQHAPVAAPGLVRRSFASLKTLIIGSLLCTNPITGVLVLGFVMRRMRWAMGKETERPLWLWGQGERRLARMTAGLRANFRAGIAGFFTLTLASLPFTALWTLAWWAGWENSFNKGYEQAAVGPLLSFLAILVSLPVLALLPMALTHQAVEGHWRAFFAWRAVRSLIGRAGWRYAALIVATAVFAIPVLVFRTSALFIEDIYPAAAEMTAEKLGALKVQLLLVQSTYVFLSLVLLRGWAARCYALAVARQARNLPRLPLRGFYWLVMLAANFGFVAQIYVAQFFNHGWFRWLNHPYFLIPTPL